MLKWSKSAELTDTNVTAAANAVVKLDLPEDAYMLKLSAAGWKADGYDKNPDYILRLFV
jgi:hypothetical protein